MSSPFSYDLDERQIKILLQHAELEFNEEAWQKFEKLSPIESKSSFENILPKVNIGISRSIIVPIIFIVLIGGFSTLLFSFVDFKKKPEVITEIPMIIKPTVKPKVKPVVPITKIIPVVTNTVAVITSSIAIVQTKTVTENKLVVKEDIKPIGNVSQSTQVENQKSKENKTKEIVIKQKKKRKLKSVELPTIKASTTNLNEGAVEPELELR
jgi:hypothetical protein